MVTSRFISHFSLRFQQFLSLGISVVLLVVLCLPIRAQEAPPTQPPLSELVEQPYLQVLILAPQLDLSRSEVADFRAELKRQKELEQKRFESQEKLLARTIEQWQRQLDALNRSASKDSEAMAKQRKEAQCQILKLEREKREKILARKHGVPVAFENKLAKLDLLAEWPAKEREIKNIVASGTARQRQYGNVEDIGIRVIVKDQEKDIKLGERAIQELKLYGLLPKEFDDKDVNDFVRVVAENIAVNSDLKVPLKVTILESDEINAFALPGGYLFVNTGLIQHVRTEAELAGVISHEIAHVTGRHGARLMKRVTIASIIFEAAQVAAIIFTGGIAGIGTYYALQYGFFGLGLMLNLALLGVCRDFEAEADQLGVQYAWRAGYDPRGFITFFDYMASEKGYVKSSSFFRTHPPFFERIVSTFSEIAYLPEPEAQKIDSSEFQAMKTRLNLLLEQKKLEEKTKPSLKRKIECD